MDWRFTSILWISHWQTSSRLVIMSKWLVIMKDYDHGWTSNRLPATLFSLVPNIKHDINHHHHSRRNHYLSMNNYWTLPFRTLAIINHKTSQSTIFNPTWILANKESLTAQTKDPTIVTASIIDYSASLWLTMVTQLYWRSTPIINHESLSLTIINHGNRFKNHQISPCDSSMQATRSCWRRPVAPKRWRMRSCALE